jgi:hypothetical protein
MRRVLTAAAVAGLIAALAVLAWNLRRDPQIGVQVLKRVELRAHSGWPAFNNPVIESVEPATPLKVLGVSYEKEMMYLRVRTPSGREGWLIPGPEVEIQWPRNSDLGIAP